ncbi:MAG: hypothetical protein Q8882_08730, partial [Bacillota bacterium]|nr:hypothetical protein [Bacillota bacterium]
TSSVILRILCFTVPLTTFYQGCQGTLKAGGAASTIIVWNIVGPWVIRIPIAFSMIKLIESGALYNTFYPYLSNLPFAETVLTSGITGLMLGFFTDYTARSIAYGIRLLKGKWLYSSL